MSKKTKLALGCNKKHKGTILAQKKNVKTSKQKKIGSKTIFTNTPFINLAHYNVLASTA